MKRVFIIAEGRWGEVTDYRDIIEIYRQILSEAKELKLSGKGEEKAATVEVVETTAEAEQKIKTEGEVDAVVFISRGMVLEAKKFAATYPRTRVIIFTGLLPEGEIIWVSKTWAADFETIQNIVLN